MYVSNVFLTQLIFKRVKVRRMPGNCKLYSGCRGSVSRMPLLEQTRFGCHELKSKNNYRIKKS